MCDNRFYICEHCGNIVGMIHDAGVPMKCCGREMTSLEPQTEDVGSEKHLPKVEIAHGTVNVDIGISAHPMTDEHGIAWVYMQTDRGGQRKCLPVGSEPKVSFAILDEKPVAVYAFCNLHGLWKTEIG